MIVYIGAQWSPREDCDVTVPGSMSAKPRHFVFANGKGAPSAYSFSTCFGMPPLAAGLLSLRMLRLARQFGGVALAISLSASITDAIGANHGELRPFNIPAQSLAEALQAYSKAANVQVMFEADSTDGYRSAAVRGNFAPEAALEVLLSKTALRARYVRSDVITLSSPSSPDADQPPVHALGIAAPDMALDTLRVHGGAEAPDDDQLAAYVSVIQVDIQRALKKVSRLRDKDYHVGVKLWIDSDHVVQKAELFRSSGEPTSDVVIASALHGLALSEAAPANTPLPIRFMIEIRSF